MPNYSCDSEVLTQVMGSRQVIWVFRSPWERLVGGLDCHLLLLSWFIWNNKTMVDLEQTCDRITIQS
jgi:hypothetical protein